MTINFRSFSVNITCRLSTERNSQVHKNIRAIVNITSFDVFYCSVTNPYRIFHNNLFYHNESYICFHRKKSWIVCSIIQQIAPFFFSYLWKWLKLYIIHRIEKSAVAIIDMNNCFTLRVEFVISQYCTFVKTKIYNKHKNLCNWQFDVMY